MVRGRGNICHTVLVGTDGHVESCLQPTVGIITTRDEYGLPVIYPVCAECKSVVMEGTDEYGR